MGLCIVYSYSIFAIITLIYSSTVSVAVGNTCTDNLQIICWLFEYHPSQLIVWYEICGVKFINFMIPMANTVFKHKWLIKHFFVL